MENFRPGRVGPSDRLVTSVSSAGGYVALPCPQTPASRQEESAASIPLIIKDRSHSLKGQIAKQKLSGQNTKRKLSGQNTKRKLSDPGLPGSKSQKVLPATSSSDRQPVINPVGSAALPTEPADRRAGLDSLSDPDRPMNIEEILRFGSESPPDSDRPASSTTSLAAPEPDRPPGRLADCLPGRLASSVTSLTFLSLTARLAAWLTARLATLRLSLLGSLFFPPPAPSSGVGGWCR